MPVHCSLKAVIGGLMHWVRGKTRVGDKLIEPLFFRIRIQSMSGLRATDEKERRG